MESLFDAVRRHVDNARHGVVPLPFGYVWNGHWCGFGSRRYKDGEIWWVQLWHPEHRNVLLSNKEITVV